MNKLSKKRLVDTLIDAYVSWREACLQVSDAYLSCASETGLRARPHSGVTWLRSTARSTPPMFTATSSGAPASFP
jgi:hypothetical protein